VASKGAGTTPAPRCRGAGCQEEKEEAGSPLLTKYPRRVFISGRGCARGASHKSLTVFFFLSAYPCPRTLGPVVCSASVPELPEVETVRRSLAPYVVGRRVTAVRARRVALREGIEPLSWHTRIVGSRLLAFDRRGKYLLARGERAVALFHLGMSGRLVRCRAEEPLEPHTHLVLCLDDGVEVRFIDPRRFGVATVLHPAEVAVHRGLAGLGPDPLCDGVEEVLWQAASRSRAPIRNVLLDQGVIAGLGNIYANEALARAGISPVRRARSISRNRLMTLGGAIRHVLDEALAAGGTTLRDGGFVDAAGDSGYFAVKLAVYGREGKPCLRCGGTVTRRVLAGRSVFYCRRCQR
jgi:formamidopyrimidine-DNA glycosylase